MVGLLLLPVAASVWIARRVKLRQEARRVADQRAVETKAAAAEREAFDDLMIRFYER
jgi:hypothetical protein